MATRRGYALRGAATIALALCLTVVAACGGSKMAELPEFPAQLAGRWVTNKAGYEGAYLNISSTILRIGTVENTVLTYSTIRVLAEETAKRVTYKLMYEDEEGEEFALNLESSAARPDEIWLTSQPNVVFTRSTKP